MPTSTSVTRRRTLMLAAAALTGRTGLAATKAQAPGAATLVPIGARLPALTMHGLNGPDRALSAYLGKPLVINVWASWCGPCRAEAASLERLAWSDAGRDFAVIGISTDDYRSAADRWLKQSNASLSHFLDHDLILERTLGADRIPTTVLVDAKGTVVQRIHGAQEWDSPDMVRQIQKALVRSGR